MSGGTLVASLPFITMARPQGTGKGKGKGRASREDKNAWAVQARVGARDEQVDLIRDVLMEQEGDEVSATHRLAEVRCYAQPPHKVVGSIGGEGGWVGAQACPAYGRVWGGPGSLCAGCVAETRLVFCVRWGWAPRRCHRSDSPGPGRRAARVLGRASPSGLRACR